MHGVSVAIYSQDSLLIEQIGRDFSYFLSTAVQASPPQISVTCYNHILPKSSWPCLLASSVSNRCVTYDQGNLRWINYYRGRAIVRWDMVREHGEIWCSESGDLSHELLYLLILSRSGAILDSRHWHRLHACAVSYEGRAILAIGPSGSGKTTLALDAVTHSNAGLISDDMPLVGRLGLIAPWPSRVGVVQRPTGIVLERFIRPFNRTEHGLKWIIDVEGLNASIVPSALPGRIVVITRTFSGTPCVKRISRWRAFKGLIGPLVFGMGVPQLLEYFLRYTWRDWLAKIPLVLSRSVAAAALSWKSDCFAFEVSDQREETLAVWRLFLKDAQREFSTPEPSKQRFQNYPIVFSES